MNRIMRILTIVSMSSVYLMQTPCLTDYSSRSGISYIPNIGGLFGLLR